MNELKEAKRAYDAIALPDELPEAVRDAVRQARRENRRSRRESRGGRVLRYAVCAAACACVAFVVTLNAVPVLAQELYGLPVIGHMARVFTLNRFEESNESSYVQVEIPALEHTGNNALETRINYEITLKVNEQVKEAKARAKEYFDAFVATGGKKEEFLPIEIRIDYEVKHNDGKVVSFVITKSEAGASFYAESTFYNLDLETGKELTLANMLGDGYIDKVNEAVRAGIAADEAAHPEDKYFDDEALGGFTTIRPDQHFYIDGDGHVVVVFAKYEIAPGYMGQREFTILP